VDDYMTPCLATGYFQKLNHIIAFRVVCELEIGSLCIFRRCITRPDLCILPQFIWYLIIFSGTLSLEPFSHLVEFKKKGRP
jgi:hypothetical protein